jgi:curved DNA-binding protein CbpA
MNLCFYPDKILSKVLQYRRYYSSCKCKVFSVNSCSLLYSHYHCNELTTVSKFKTRLQFFRHYATQKQNYYQILNIPETSTENEIKKAYKKLALKWHPDRHQGKQQKVAAEKFCRIAEAYATLGNKEKRRLYDDTRRNFTKNESFSEPFQKTPASNWYQYHMNFDVSESKARIIFDEFLNDFFNKNSLSQPFNSPFHIHPMSSSFYSLYDDIFTTDFSTPNKSNGNHFFVKTSFYNNDMGGLKSHILHKKKNQSNDVNTCDSEMKRNGKTDIDDRNIFETLFHSHFKSEVEEPSMMNVANDLKQNITYKINNILYKLKGITKFDDFLKNLVMGSQSLGYPFKNNSAVKSNNKAFTFSFSDNFEYSKTFLWENLYKKYKILVSKIFNYLNLSLQNPYLMLPCCTFLILYMRSILHKI